MSQMGQKLKGSDGANAFRSTSEPGHSSVQPLAPLSINAINKSDRKWPLVQQTTLRLIELTLLVFRPRKS